MIGDTYEANKSDGALYVFLSMAYMSILLSANLGVMNLLPIPALDGGRLVFLFLEVLRGKPIDQNKEGLVHMIGLVALMILMVFVMFNDISRLF
jgi:regulator of sigma E protease